MSTSSDAPLVGIVMGSATDWDVMQRATKTLAEFDVAYEARVLSAHRTPDETAEWAKSAEDRGLRVLIAAAGGAGGRLEGMDRFFWTNADADKLASWFDVPRRPKNEDSAC